MNQLSFHCRHRYAGGFELDVAFQTQRLITCLFGRSGSGKTSVLEMIAGLRPCDQGTIRLGSRCLLETAQHVDQPPHRRRIGLVFQDHLLFPHLTVERNLRYGQRRAEKSQRTIPWRRVAEVLEIEPLLRRYPRNLSGGERQRVALGRALLSGPELLLMDEPLAALDERIKLRILSYLERVVAEWQIPTLFVSHAQAEVRRLADWVIVLDAGRVVAEGPPDEALASPSTLEWKNEAGPTNLLRVEQLQPSGGNWQGRIGDQWLQLPSLPAPPALPLFIELSPSAIVLGSVDAQHLSARNHLRGRVRRQVDTAMGTFVAVDVGQILWAVVTREAAAELALKPGREVVCIIKTHSLEVLA